MPGDGALEREARSALEARGIEFSVEVFLEAVRKGDAELVQSFIHAGMPVESCGSVRPLEAAVDADQGAVVGLLVRTGAPLELVDAGGATLLMRASLGHRTKAVQALIAAGARVNARDSRGQTALSVAASEGDCTIAGLLIEAGAEVDLIDHAGDTPLLIAARKRHPEVVEILAVAGADVAHRNADNHSAADIAARAGFGDVARVLHAAERGGLRKPERSRAYAVPHPYPDPLVEARRRERLGRLFWALFAVCVALTVVNLLGVVPVGPALPEELQPSPGEIAAVTLRFAVERIESFREEHGRLPADLDEVGLNRGGGWTYAQGPAPSHYTVVVEVGGIRATHDSARTGRGSIGDPGTPDNGGREP